MRRACSARPARAGSASRTIRSAPIAFVERLWDGLGPVLVVAAVGLVLALVHRTRADLVLAVFCLVYFAQLMTIEAHFDRYVLPLIPALGALAGRLRSVAPVTILLLAVPLTWSVRETRDLTKDRHAHRRAPLDRRERASGRANRSRPVDSRPGRVSRRPPPPAAAG